MNESIIFNSEFLLGYEYKTNIEKIHCPSREFRVHILFYRPILSLLRNKAQFPFHFEP